MIDGDVREQYGRIWDYVAIVRETNPGSTVKVGVDRPSPNERPVFDGIYMCLGAVKQWFLEGRRPIIGLDGCHLSRPYRRILLSGVARDDNDNIFPLVVVVQG